MDEVCMWCIKFMYDTTNGSLNYDECVQGCVEITSETRENDAWTDDANGCLTRVYDMGADKPWADRCDCTGLHYESSKDYWGRVGLA